MKIKNNAVYSHSKENEILRHKLNKKYTGSVYWKLQNADKKKIKDLNKETELYVNYDLKIKKEEETHWVMGRKTLHNKHDNSPQITGVI